MFVITLQQVFILLFYIMLGFTLCKTKLVGREGSKILSKLLVCVFLPAYTVTNLASSVSVERIVEYALSLALGTAVALLMIGFGFFASKFFAKERLEKAIYQYVFAFGNIGYFGYPLIGEAFPEVLATYMLFCLPLNIAINTYGYFILTQTPDAVGEKRTKRQIAKSIFTFPTMGLLVGLTLGLLPLQIPAFFFSILAPAQACMSASAMLLAGIVLAGCSVKELFCSVKPYLASALRLLLCPLLFGGVAFALYKLVGLNENVFICIVASACLPAGMNAIVFPESVGASGKSGAKVCFISYLFALATIPLWFYVLSILI